MNDENYYVVQGWMINLLKLSGNELLTYAVIYGFSQNEGDSFGGGLNYLCQAIGYTKPSAIKCLQSLQEKGFIFKNKFAKNGVKNTQYFCNLSALETATSKETLPVKKLKPSNFNIYNNTKHTKDIKAPCINNTSNKELNIQGTIGSNNTLGPIGNKAKTAPAQRVLIQPKTAKNGAPCGFSGRGGVSALFNEIEGGKAVLDKFSLFVKSAQEAGMKVGRVWLRAQVDLINWVEDPDDKILVLQKTMERGWKSLRFVVEEMFGCKIESQRKNIITKTKIGGCKYD